MKVTVHYKGKGKVDASHKLWVWVFDTPNIGPGSMPLDQVALDKNDIEAVFEGVAADKVWIAVAYDESGGMMGDASAACRHADRHPGRERRRTRRGDVGREGHGCADVR